LFIIRCFSLSFTFILIFIWRFNTSWIWTFLCLSKS
jgi:hypothetical protein